MISYKRNILVSILIYLLFCYFLLPVNTFAFKFEQPPGLGVSAITSGAGAPERLIERIITNVIGIFFIVGGLGVVVYFVWGAVDWILSGGDKEKVSNARKKMTHALIGLTLLSLSYVIINIIGQIVGFNPLGYLQLRSLDSTGDPMRN